MKGLLSHKKALAVILIILLCAGLCSCRENPPEPQGNDGGETGPVTLTAVYHKEDGLNPFTMSSALNRQIISLMHRGLYYLDTRFCPVADIASDVDITGTTVEVAIGENYFSDGRRVTAEDVVYSFEKAKDSPLYREQLTYIDKCTEKNDSAVIFTLNDRNVNILMALTFPIVKSGTAENDTSKPAGCGYYMYNVTRLEASPYYKDSLPADIIELYDASSSDAVTSLVDSGDVDLFYTDLSGGDTVQCSSESTSVYLNNLIYIGLNGADGNLRSQTIRRALSLGIDRRAIAQGALQGNARPASVPFNTSWGNLADCVTAGKISDSADKAAAAKLLSAFGVGEEIPEDETTGEETEDSPKVRTVDLRLAYPDSNSYMFAVASLIREQLAAFSVRITIVPVTSSEYLNVLDSGDFDMYLGEIKISDDMDISALMSPYGNASYGISYYLLDSDEYYTDYVQGDISMDDFLAKFLEEQPFIPLAYRNGKFFRSSKIASVGEITENRVFGSIDSWLLAAPEAETTE